MGQGTERRRGRAKGRATVEDRVTKGRQHAEEDVGALDNPDIADEPSEVRHGLYFAAVIAFAIALNLVAMVLVSGGQ